MLPLVASHILLTGGDLLVESKTEISDYCLLMIEEGLLVLQRV